MQSMADNSIDLVLTDPPYGLKFMGKKWDYDVPPTHVWYECLRVLKPGGHVIAFSGSRTYHRMACRIEDAGFEIRDMLAWLYGSGFPKSKTQLKPAIEPMVLARKPLIGTIRNNVEQYGVGQLNIDECRTEKAGSQGRYPTNVLHDGSEEVVGEFPYTKSGSTLTHHKFSESENNCMSGKNYARSPKQDHIGDSGPASRFFYCAKASKRDRGEGNNHATVKPIALMEYLVKLASSEGQTILDPFMGSGTTGIACQNLNRNFIGIEMNEEYFEIAKSRINNAVMETLF